MPLIGGTRQGLLAVDRVAAAQIGPPPQRDTAAPQKTEFGSLLAGGARDTIHEVDAKRVLAQAGIPVVAERLAGTLDAATAAANEIGFPVALKVVADELAHKTEHRLVELGLADAGALADAWHTLEERVAHLRPKPQIAGMVVQRMVPGGVEVIAGIKRDPDFGLVMVLGPGGVLVEVIDAVALRPLPLRQGDAEAMIAETPLGKLLAGARGQAADYDALVKLIYALSDFADAEQASIAEIDLNPIKVLPVGQGCAAVDALIIPQPGSTAAA